MVEMTICGKWVIHVDDDDFYNIELEGPVPSFFKPILEQTRAVARGTWCCDKNIRHIADRVNAGVAPADIVVEYFGGAGINSIIIQNILHPAEHHIVDLDVSCARHLKKMFIDYADVRVRRADAYEVMGDVDADMVGLDINVTWCHLRDDKKLMAGLRRVFDNHPNYVQVTETAVNWIHVNKAKYSKWMGRRVDNLFDYLDGLSDYFENEFGYAMSSVAWHDRACRIVFEPADAVREYTVYDGNGEHADVYMKLNTDAQQFSYWEGYDG